MSELLPAPAPAETVYHRDPLPDVPDDPLAQAPICAACPKLCAPTCPVQAATGRESVAPWRISAAARDAERSGWTAEALHVTASCTGCGACSHSCAPGVRLPELSRAARTAAAAAGKRLPAAGRVAARLSRTGSPRPRDRWAGELAAGSDPAAVTALFYGCTVQTHTPEVGRAAQALLAAAGEPARCSAEETCCGAAAADLGLAPEAAALAAACAAQVAGAEQVVVLSPGCARMMREDWPRLGLGGPAVVTSVEWLDSALSEHRLPAAVGTTGIVAWHDPCTLSRLLGVVDAPRRVLDALGFDRREPAATGLHTRCSGGGQAYPLVDADGASAVAAVRATELRSLAAPVVSACPQAERMLTAAGAPTRDILEVAAERLLGLPPRT
ncbi:MAG TPA: (Fe-S)-binding protein [Mycobacteriales bacterium]|nr:(Fe-S)-binding protein [Mycobacteriales bacterium]